VVRHFLLAVAFCSVGAAASAAAPADDTALLMAPVQLLVAAINHGAATPPAGIFTVDSTVLDDFAPYRWSGKATGADWYSDLVGTKPADRVAFLALQGQLSVGAPSFLRVNGDDAYFVLPGTFSFNADPKTRVRQTAAWIITERREGGAWRIAGHAWAITGETRSRRLGPP
jgi:hypothetical protein